MVELVLTEPQLIRLKAGVTTGSAESTGARRWQALWERGLPSRAHRRQMHPRDRDPITGRGDPLLPRGRSQDSRRDRPGEAIGQRHVLVTSPAPRAAGTPRRGTARSFPPFGRLLSTPEPRGQSFDDVSWGHPGARWPSQSRAVARRPSRASGDQPGAVRPHGPERARRAMTRRLRSTRTVPFPANPRLRCS